MKQRMQWIGAVLLAAAVLFLSAGAWAGPQEELDAAEKLATEKKTDEAITAFGKIADNESAPAPLRVRALSRMADLYQETVAARSGWPATSRVNLLVAAARLCLEQSNDPGQAETVAREAIQLAESNPQGVDAYLLTAVAGAYDRVASAQLASGAKDKAVATLRGYLEKYSGSNALNPSYITAATFGPLQRLIELGAGPESLGPLSALLRKSIGTDLQQGQFANAELRQQTLIRALTGMGSKEALGEARVLFYACASGNLPAAIDSVTMAFKAADLSLARANGFLKFLRFGPAGEDEQAGTADDLTNPLASVPPLTDPERTRLYRQALEAQPASYAGWQRRATIHLYLDQPVEAFRMLQKAFQECPNTAASLQAATDALTGLMIRLTKETVAAEQLVQYLMYGELGPDGKSGTGDDAREQAGKTALVRNAHAARELGHAVIAVGEMLLRLLGSCSRFSQEQGHASTGGVWPELASRKLWMSPFCCDRFRDCEPGRRPVR
jgi:tetratricopeptide (TPR) repeat protein